MVIITVFFFLSIVYRILGTAFGFFLLLNFIHEAYYEKWYFKVSVKKAAYRDKLRKEMVCLVFEVERIFHCSEHAKFSLPRAACLPSRPRSSNHKFFSDL